MKDPMVYIDRFCRKHPNFGIPNIMKYVAIGNLVFWLLGFANTKILSYIVFSPYLILHGQIWRLISFIFYPPGSGILTAIAIYFYYMIGTALERYWGTARFNVYFFTGVILTAVYGFVLYFITGVSYGISAEFIYLSMFFSFAVIYPDMKVLLFFIIPVKMKWLAIVDAAFFLIEIIQLRFPVNLLPVVALLNFLIFCGGELWRKVFKKKTPETINFRRESAKIRREQQANLYNHKCAVCGRTDAEYPNLEFRYCSRCAGYHCFCEDHINSHIHFTE